MTKTNAMRSLENAGIDYEIREYEWDESDLSAETVAKKIGMPQEQVFKTLVARGDQTGLLFAVLPAGTDLDLKKLASASDNRKVELLPLKEVEAATGYVRGAVTALGARKAYPVFADETMTIWETISISCGKRGMQAILNPNDYLRVTEATVSELIR